MYLSITISLICDCSDQILAATLYWDGSKAATQSIKCPNCGCSTEMSLTEVKDLKREAGHE